VKKVTLLYEITTHCAAGQGIIKSHGYEKGIIKTLLYFFPSFSAPVCLCGGFYVLGGDFHPSWHGLC
jgi:hypothetical protein